MLALGEAGHDLLGLEHDKAHDADGGNVDQRQQQAVAADAAERLAVDVIADGIADQTIRPAHARVDCRVVTERRRRRRRRRKRRKEDGEEGENMKTDKEEETEEEEEKKPKNKKGKGRRNTCFILCAALHTYFFGKSLSAFNFHIRLICLSPSCPSSFFFSFLCSSSSSVYQTGGGQQRGTDGHTDQTARVGTGNGQGHTGARRNGNGQTNQQRNGLATVDIKKKKKKKKSL